jgi:hypothetical protein
MRRIIPVAMILPLLMGGINEGAPVMCDPAPVAPTVGGTGGRPRRRRVVREQTDADKRALERAEAKRQVKRFRNIPGGRGR